MAKKPKKKEKVIKGDEKIKKISKEVGNILNKIGKTGSEILEKMEQTERELDKKMKKVLKSADTF